MRDIEFLYEVGSLRNVQRTWRQQLGIDCANDLEHTMRVVWLALMLARRVGGCNEEKIIKMALVHDIAETRTGDLNYVQKVYNTPDENRAAHDLFYGTSVENFQEILEEYEKRNAKEAQIVKDADNLDVDIEMKEFEERGHQLPAKWKQVRTLVRNEKLYTEAAKQLWDEIQISDPSSWHLKANKWFKMPETGR